MVLKQAQPSQDWPAAEPRGQACRSSPRGDRRPPQVRPPCQEPQPRRPASPPSGGDGEL